MAQGLQVWDASGLLIVDTSTLLPRSVEIGQVTAAGSASIVPIQQGMSVGVPVVVSDTGVPPPEVTLVGATLSWAPRGDQGMNARLTVMLL